MKSDEYWGHLYRLTPSRISGAQNASNAECREVHSLEVTSRLKSMKGSMVFDSYPQTRQRTWLCKKPPKIEKISVSCCWTRRRVLNEWTAIALCCTLSIKYRRNSWLSSWRPQRNCFPMSITTTKKSKLSIYKRNWVIRDEEKDVRTTEILHKIDWSDRVSIIWVKYSTHMLFQFTIRTKLFYFHFLT
jgi:hypothetical protein